MHTKAELDDEFDAVDADECTEMRMASELGHSTESLSVNFEFGMDTVEHHLNGCCSHY